MSKQHYLPATYIGRFSHDHVRRARDRRVYVLRQQASSAFESPAAKILYSRNLYTLLNTWEPSTVDDSWEQYEPTLGRALNKLVDPARVQQISLRDWLETLVPFVSGLFIRTKNFEQRFTNRFPDELQQRIHGDNVNIARLIEWTRLKSGVMCSRWILIKNRTTIPIISNELGLGRTQDPETGELGWVIPIDSWHALVVTPQSRHAIGVWRSGSWESTVETQEVWKSTSIASLNQTLALSATELVFGASRTTVHEVKDELNTETETSWTLDWTPMHGDLRSTEGEWQAALTTENISPSFYRQAALIELAKSGIDPVRSAVLSLSKPLFITNHLYLLGETLHLSIKPIK